MTMSYEPGVGTGSAAYTPVEYWHTPLRSSEITAARLEYPLHYHLRRHDYIAFQKELCSGTSPFHQDNFGRTALDLAIDLLEDLLISVLCTSFPVDFFCRTLSYDAKFPAKFVAHYSELYNDIYDHHQALRMTPGAVTRLHPRARSTFARFQPVRWPAFKHETLPSHFYDFAPAAAGSRGVDADGGPSAQFRVFHPDPKTPGRSGGAGNDRSAYQSQLLIVVEDAVKSSVQNAGAIRGRLTDILGNVSGLLRSVSLMATCEPLRLLAMKERELFSSLDYPYLFLALLQVLFETYPKNPQGEPWDTSNPADARRLLNLVAAKRMKSREILSFLRQLPAAICAMARLGAGEGSGWPTLPLPPHLAEHYMLMAFALGSPDLFFFAAGAAGGGGAASGLEGFSFDWHRCLSDLRPFRAKFAHFVMPLLLRPGSSREARLRAIADYWAVEAADAEALLAWWRAETLKLRGGNDRLRPPPPVGESEEAQ